MVRRGVSGDMELFYVEGDTRRTEIVEETTISPAIRKVVDVMEAEVGLPPDLDGNRYYNRWDSPVIDEHDRQEHSARRVAVILIKEYDSRHKSEKNVYVPIDSRTFTKEDEAAAGKAIGKLFAASGYRLNMGSTEAGKVAMDAMRAAIMKTDGSLNIEGNKALRKEINDRYKAAQDAWEELLDNIRLGIEPDPVGKIRKLKETQW